MPMTFYADTSQISKRVNKYEFKLPTFGESRTDPTFYEPTATRIANMRKSASSGVSLFDYEGDFSRSDIQKQTREHFIEPAREIGITREEISQIQNEASRNVDLKIAKAEEEKLNTIDKQREIADMAKIAKSAISDNSAGAE